MCVFTCPFKGLLLMKKTDKALKTLEYKDPSILIYGAHKISNKQLIDFSRLKPRFPDLPHP